jgi:hypothetical protein
MEQFKDEPLEFFRLDLALGGSASEVATRRQAATAGTAENLVLEGVRRAQFLSCHGQELSTLYLYHYAIVISVPRKG